MQDKKEDQNRFMKWSAVALSVIALLVFLFLIRFERYTTVKVMELAQDEVQEQQRETDCEEAPGESYLILQKGDESGEIGIPLDGTVASTQITAENRYLSNQIIVQIAGAKSDFYKDIVISGNKMQVRDAFYHMEEDGLHIRFDMDRIYEISTKYEKKQLTISLNRPKDKYDKIVILDPGIQHSDITWDIAAKTKNLLEEKDIKVYLSRKEQAAEQECNIADLAGNIYPDMLIGITLDEDRDAQVLGTKVQYDGTYFTPGITNVMLADILEHQVTMAIEGKVLGIDNSTQPSSWENIPVPAACLVAGYRTNPQEYALLCEAQYRQKIAEGISNAVLAAYEKME